MKVFISWSGDNSRKIATILHEWLPSVLQCIDPYMSAESIDKGQRWSQDIATQLQDTHYGIICVTPDNLAAPWILFESGALSKSIQQARVSPIIFGLSPSDLAGSPLLHFQQTQFNQNDMHKLIVSVNNSAREDERITPENLAKAFNRAWAELETAISSVDLSSAPANKASPADTPKPDNKVPDAIEEILANGRTQLKLLRSHEDILPPGYLLAIVRQAIEHSTRSSSERQERAKRELWANVAALTREIMKSYEGIIQAISPSTVLSAAVLRDKYNDIAFSYGFLSEGLRSIPLSQLGNENLIGALVDLAVAMRKTQAWLDHLLKEDSVQKQGNILQGILSGKTEMFNAVAAILRTIEGQKAEEHLGPLASRI